ncbi:MAG: 4Fe-4S dicluster domain-containing protein [Deltaproteobacteria bacterium]|nr:4Fe-4S dicluster domain-containing protein [Deltaproteobacteria bacterium]
MENSRRKFLKVAGISVLGLGVKPVIDAVASDGTTTYAPKSEALRGERWAMVVDTRKCKNDCTDCITACHTIHNVPDIKNPKHEVKWLWTEKYEHAFPGMEHEYLSHDVENRPFMILCNHCEDPACVRVCPTKATFKREDGIVLMDMHRCIGCRFCMAACPFGARSFNWMDPRPFVKDENEKFPTRMKGVVEKCNFCAERLAEGLMPACVEACKEKALIFGDLEDPNSEVRKVLSSNYTIRRKPELGTKPMVYYIV